MSEEIIHPGLYVRQNVIPQGMSVTEAAKLLDIGRPALSNFLNGKADLSTEMAARLEQVFGARARNLLDMQSANDAARTNNLVIAASVKPYVPPFLQLKAAKIEEWAASGIAPRHRLAVLLRTLVNSTGVQLMKVDFPGNDDSEQPGWDGEIIASLGNPWIPSGHSGWEFGVNNDPKKKADGDFAKSVKAVNETERKDMIFVFVTPRKWAGKTAWITKHKSKNLWKDVRAYDASDLEQWLEQSIAAQVWFANETGQNAHGAISLDEAWKHWSADCDPPLIPSMFADAVEAQRVCLLRTLNGNKPTVISADSCDEALAFLHSAFASEDDDLGIFRDRIIVFREPGALGKLAGQISNFIPVIVSRKVENEFAPYSTKMPSFIIYPRNAAKSKPDIVLETLNDETFRITLDAMGLDEDRIRQLSRESACSPTVLRRRLSKLSAIRTPDWALNQKFAQWLIPFLFAGTWNADNEADRYMLRELSDDVEWDVLERQFGKLWHLESSPVWTAGTFRGVISKIDLLFAIKDLIGHSDLQKFFEVAEVVLSEDNPALTLPEDKRWLAVIYGKTREISKVLRDGIAETLVLLAVYGPDLFKTRLGTDTSEMAERLVRSLLTPLSGNSLESQSDNLPIYAEDAPRTFLSIIEEDLKKPESHCMALMRPVPDLMFGSSPRTGLLWALEGLAWSPETFTRTVLALGRLGDKTIDDKLHNKPTASLASIFRCWLPQTGANLEARVAALEKLTLRHPDVAWPICVDQIEFGTKVGHHNYKPRWRPDGHGYGGGVSTEERSAFSRRAFEIALNWRDHDRHTLGDLIANLDGVSEEEGTRVWDVVDQWIEDASDVDRAWLREKIRATMLSIRRIKRNNRNRNQAPSARAFATYERLEPTDPLLRQEWLFRQRWVEPSAYELSEENLDFRKWNERIAELQEAAVKEIFLTGGIGRVLELAELGQTSNLIGWFLVKVLADDDTLANALVSVVRASKGWGGPRLGLVSGALERLHNENRTTLKALRSKLTLSEYLAVLLAAPFKASTWEIVEDHGGVMSTQYWREIDPGWSRDQNDLLKAIEKLLAAGRPRAAFNFAHFNLQYLPPKVLYELLVAIATVSKEQPNTYQLDGHYVKEAFDLLNSSGTIPVDDMAGLEFLFIDAFERKGDRLVNLEKRIEKNPQLFVQAIALGFKRQDDGEDPVELRATNDEQAAKFGSASYKLLDKLGLIPGHDANGELDANELRAWVNAVRTGCSQLGRTQIGDEMIGGLLAKAPAAGDGVWPCLPVRDVLEQLINGDIQRGLITALHNSRGIHSRAEGGNQERELAAKYRGWAEAMDYTHPQVATIMRDMERSYLREAGREDNDAIVRRRIGH